MKKSKNDFGLMLTGLGILSLLFNACISQKKITYFQQKSDSSATVPFDTTFIAIIHPNDIINVFVTSVNPEASKYFNFSDRPESMAGSVTSVGGPNSYLVDAEGYIQLPLVGSVKVGGLTSHIARDTILSVLGKYIENPSVKLNIQNFKVTILGEVNKPGVYFVSTEKMTFTDALSLASDLSMYGRRDNIMLIREVNGKKNFYTVDITGRDFFSSPYYNLRSNDIIYIEPLKSKKYALENWYKVLPLFLSTISVAIVLIRIYQ